MYRFFHSFASTKLLHVVPSSLTARCRRRFLCGAVCATIPITLGTCVAFAKEEEEKDLIIDLKGGAESPHAAKTWGVPYDWDWDGRMAEAKKRNLVKSNDVIKRQIILIRHGEYNTKVKDDTQRTLTERGRSQAHRTGLALKQMFSTCPLLLSTQPRVIHVSDLTRAQQTLNEILPSLPSGKNVTVVRNANLREGLPCPPDPPLGRVKKMSVDDLDAQATRAERAFREIFYRPLDKSECGVEIVVGHSNVFRYFMCRALQVPPEAWLRTRICHCSMSRFTVYSSGKVMVECFGDVGHLPPEMHTTS
eukprot:PhM_4_TR18928/c0_g1_i1/m.63225/K15637/PGAM5; serine/threonine-protein phosphatase PGAM5